MKLIEIVRKNHETINAITNILLVFITSLGLIAAMFAYKYYKDANIIALNNVLESAENNVYDMALDGKPYLLRVMYFCPPENVSPRKQAELIFQSLFDKNVDIKWKTIPELCSIYFGSLESIRTSDTQRVTESVLSFEKLILVADQAITNEGLKILGGSDWSVYANALIDDYGENPFFLAALHIDHTYGYITKEFSELMRTRLKDKPVVREIYPEIMNPMWAKLNPNFQKNE